MLLVDPGFYHEVNLDNQNKFFLAFAVRSDFFFLLIYNMYSLLFTRYQEQQRIDLL